jgi:hypothetical protein
LTIAIFVGLIGPAAVAVVAIVIAIVRIFRRRAFAWIVPLAGGALATVVFYTAVTIAYGAADINFWSQ